MKENNFKVGEVIYSDYPGCKGAADDEWGGLRVVKGLRHKGGASILGTSMQPGFINWEHIHKLPNQDKRFFDLIKNWKYLDKKMIEAIDKFIKEVKVLKGI